MDTKNSVHALANWASRFQLSQCFHLGPYVVTELSIAQYEVSNKYEPFPLIFIR